MHLCYEHRSAVLIRVRKRNFLFFGGYSFSFSFLESFPIKFNEVNKLSIWWWFTVSPSSYLMVIPLITKPYNELPTPEYIIFATNKKVLKSEASGEKFSLNQHELGVSLDGIGCTSLLEYTIPPPVLLLLLATKTPLINFIKNYSFGT